MKKIILFLLILAIFILAIMHYKKRIAPPPVENKTSQILKGIFRNTQTGKDFEYSDPNGYLYDCKKINCKSVYFDTDSKGTINQILDVSNNPVFGTISDIKYIDTEHVQYTFEYQKSNKIYHTTYAENLCSYFKGGDKQCHSSVQKGHVASLLLSQGSDSTIEYATIFNNMLKADVLEILSVDYRA